MYLGFWGELSLFSQTESPKTPHIIKHRRVNAAPDLLIEFGVRRSLVDEQFDDMFVSLPCSQMERIAALVVGDVGQGLVP